MARPDRKRRGQATRRSWREAAIGGLLVALGGALLGRGRATAAPAPEPAAPPRDTATARPRPKTGRGGKPKVRTKPKPAPVPVRTRYWPPPAAKPIAPDGAAAGSHHDGATYRRATSERQDTGDEGAGHERTDIEAGTVATVILSSAVVLVLAIAGLFVLVGWVQRGARQGPSLTEQQRAAIVPPAPRLQDHPLHDIAALRQRESDRLDHYAWTDAGHLSARIPIARAEALVTGRSLDPAPDLAAAPARP